MTIERLADGTVRLEDATCNFVFETIRPGRLLVRISGKDTGSFGTEPVDLLATEISRNGKLRLFIDASAADAMSPAVTDLWRSFFSDNRTSLEQVLVLVGSNYVEFMVGATLHLARMGRRVTVTTDPEWFRHLVDRERAPAIG